MPIRSPLRAEESASRRDRRVGFALVIAAVAALGAFGAARADEPVACGAELSADDAMRRLNEVRQRRVTCRGADAPLTAAPLRWSDSLAVAAQRQAREMALSGQMSHRDRENRPLAQRLGALGYRFSTAVENVAVGQPSLDEVVGAWLASEGHCVNMMNAAVVEFGLACVDAVGAAALERRRYWALVLAAPRRSR